MSEVTTTKTIDTNNSISSAKNENNQNSTDNTKKDVFLEIIDELLHYSNSDIECEIDELCSGIDILENDTNKIDVAELDGVDTTECFLPNISEFNVNTRNKSTGVVTHLLSQEFEEKRVRMNFNFTENSDYQQNHPETSLPKNSVFELSNTSKVILETSEIKDLSTVEYQKSHSLYYEQQKVASEAKLDFSLEKIENKILTQINFAVSKTKNSGNERISVQLVPKELGKIEIHIETLNNERSITINADKISTYEILRRNSTELSQNLVFNKNDEQMNTNLQFEYKDLSNWEGSKDQDFDDNQNTVLLVDKIPAMLNAITPNTITLRVVDKLVDCWV